MARLMRCDAGHVFDSAEHESCPDCPKPAPAPVVVEAVSSVAPSMTAGAPTLPASPATSAGRETVSIPVTWLAAGVAVVAAGVAAWWLLLKPQAEPVRTAALTQQPAAAPAAKSEAKPESKAEANSEAKAEAKSAPKAEAKAEPKAEPKAETKSASNDAPAADAKSEVKAPAPDTRVASRASNDEDILPSMGITARTNPDSGSIPPSTAPSAIVTPVTPPQSSLSIQPIQPVQPIQPLPTPSIQPLPPPPQQSVQPLPLPSPPQSVQPLPPPPQQQASQLPQNLPVPGVAPPPPPPLSPTANYADELTDWGVRSQMILQSDVGNRTPLDLPGARRVTTAELPALAAKSMLIDVLDTNRGHLTIPGAVHLPGGGNYGRGNYSDSLQRNLAGFLARFSNRDPEYPLIFFCEGAQCWESYNAALRALNMGYRNVYWYRGGLQSWKAANLPVQPPVSVQRIR